MRQASIISPGDCAARCVTFYLQGLELTVRVLEY